jgi:hypothetical protein
LIINIIFLNLGVPQIFDMFVRKKKNASGSQSVQVIQKFRGKYKVVKNHRLRTARHEIEWLEAIGQGGDRAFDVENN